MIFINLQQFRASGGSEEHYKTDHLLAEHTETTQQLKWRGVFFIILVSNFADNFWEADLIRYPNPTGRAAFSNDTNPVILMQEWLTSRFPVTDMYTVKKGQLMTEK